MKACLIVTIFRVYIESLSVLPEGHADEKLNFFLKVQGLNASSALVGAELVCVEHFKNKGRVASLKHFPALLTTRVCLLHRCRLVRGERTYREMWR